MARFERLKDYETPRAELEEEFAEGGKARSFAFLLAGICIGAGAALLWTPNSGEEVRYAIGRGYRKTAKRIARRTQNLRDRAEDLIERAQDLRDNAYDLKERGAKLLRFGRRRAAERAVEKVVRRYREG